MPVALTLSEWIGPEPVAADPGLGTRFVKSMSSLRDRQDHREGNAMSFKKGDGTIQSRSGNVVHIRAIDNGRLAEIAADALREATAGHASPIKMIAQAADSTTRAARNWYEGQNAPDTLHHERLRDAFPEYARAFARLSGRGWEADEIAPEEAQALMAAAAVLQRWSQK